MKKSGEMASHLANVGETDNSNYYTEGDVYYSKGYVLSDSCSQLTNAWILNFRCSYHMTPNKDWFTTYKSYDFVVSI